VAAAVTAAACGSSGGSSATGATQNSGDHGNDSELTHVVLAVSDPSVAVSTSPYSSLPIQLGYYKDEGLDVEVHPDKGGALGVQAVSSGHALTVSTGMTAFYPALLKDPTMRIPYVGGNVYRIVVPASSSITKVSQLKGKKVGVQSLGATSYLYARAEVEAAGLDPDNDITWIPIGVGDQAAAAVKKHEVVAYGGYDSINTILSNLIHQKVRILPSSLNSLPAFTGFIFRKETLQNKPKIATGFIRAVLKSVLFAHTNPKAAVCLHWKQYPEQMPTGKNKKAALKDALRILKSRLDSSLHPDKQGRYGYATPKQVQKTANFLTKKGFLKQHIDTSKFVDLSINKAYNNFDHQAVIKRAKQAHPC
jgi:NitT/TauT family transport system substrate-binding protein